MSLAIVIPVYNEEQHIKECLKSVLAFEIPKNVEHEIWVIDGGSKEDSNTGATPSLSQGVKYLNKQSGGFRYGLRSKKKEKKV